MFIASLTISLTSSGTICVSVLLIRARTRRITLTCPMAVPNDPLNGSVRFVEVGRFAIQPAQASLRVSDDGAKRLV